MSWRGRLARRLPRLADAVRRARRTLRRARVQEYAIALLRGASPLALAPDPHARVPVLTRRDVRDVPARAVADPFLWRADGVWHLFFEVVRADSGRGEIGLATSRDGRAWAYRGIVLAEPFHLSYPHVFADGGEVYLIPETGEAGAVRLYRATDFPTRWALERELLTGAAYLDATPFRHGGRWWMFVSAPASEPGAPRWSTLRLFGAADLLGPWREHPASPIVRADPTRARPAGRVVAWKGRPLRVAQDCSRVYGEAVRAFAIDVLDEERYRERQVGPDPLFGPGGRAWHRGGMHHIDAHETDDGWLAVVDGWRWRRRLR